MKYQARVNRSLRVQAQRLEIIERVILELLNRERLEVNVTPAGGIELVDKPVPAPEPELEYVKTDDQDQLPFEEPAE